MHTQNLQVTATTQSGMLVTGACRVLFHAFKESTGSAPAAYNLTDGNATGAKVILPITLGANESTRDWLGNKGLEVQDGVYFQLVSGSVIGNIQVVMEDEYQADQQRLLAALQASAGA